MSIAQYISYQLEPLLEPLSNYMYADNTLGAYGQAIILFILAIAFLIIGKYLILNQLIRISQRTRSYLDDAILHMVDSYGWPLYVWISFWVSLKMLVIPDSLNSILQVINNIIIVYYVVVSLQKSIQYSFQRIINQKSQKDDIFDPSILIFFQKIVEGLLYLGGLLVILQNTGFNVTTLLGGLGIGGIAVAFALQNVLADVFASLSIFFDRPFQAGDFVVIGDDLGIIQKIGIKSTRIKTLQGELLVISNKELTESRIHNYQHMEKRRVAFQFGLTYQTSSRKLHKVNGLVAEVVQSIEQVELDRVHFYQFGDSALVFEAVYYIGDRDYNLYMDVQQTINLGIKDRLEKEGIEFAYPTQTVYIKKS